LAWGCTTRNRPGRPILGHHRLDQPHRRRRRSGLSSLRREMLPEDRIRSKRNLGWVPSTAANRLPAPNRREGNGRSEQRQSALVASGGALRASVNSIHGSNDATRTLSTGEKALARMRMAFPGRLPRGVDGLEWPSHDVPGGGHDRRRCSSLTRQRYNLHAVVVECDTTPGHFSARQFLRSMTWSSRLLPIRVIPINDPGCNSVRSVTERSGTMALMPRTRFQFDLWSLLWLVTCLGVLLGLCADFHGLLAFVS